MDVRLASYREWTEGAQVIQCGDPYVIKDGSGLRIDIRPAITHESSLLITGRDFVPIRADGTALLEGAVHTPSIYLGKRRAILPSGTARLGEVRRIDEPCLLVGGSTNIYHWLVDYLPRLLMARKHIDASVPLIVNGELARFQVESLEMLGIKNRLIHLGEEESVLCRSVWFPYLLASTTVPHPMVPKLIREAFKPTRNARKRVYLSRADATSRRLLNEPAMYGLLNHYGFETNVVGEMSLREQIALFADAEAVITAHGAGMANMMFCEPGAKVLEIALQSYRVTSMALLAGACGLRHAFISAKNIGTGKDGNPLLADWQVDLRDMKQAMASL